MTLPGKEMRVFLCQIEEGFFALDDNAKRLVRAEVSSIITPVF